MNKRIIFLLIVTASLYDNAKGQELAVTGGAAWNVEFVSDGTEGYDFLTYFVGFQYVKAINPTLSIVANPTVMFYNIGKPEEEGHQWKNINIEVPLLGRTNLFRTRAVKLLWGITPGFTVSSKFVEYDGVGGPIEESKVEPRNPYLKLVAGVDYAVFKKIIVSAIFDYRITNVSPEIPHLPDYEDKVTVLAINIKLAYRIK